MPPKKAPKPLEQMSRKELLRTLFPCVVADYHEAAANCYGWHTRDDMIAQIKRERAELARLEEKKANPSL